jgi:hypothetical protein
MAAIVRAADLPHEKGGPPEALGVLAIFDGIRDSAVTDEERLARGAPVCDALYAYCSSTA